LLAFLIILIGILSVTLCLCGWFGFFRILPGYFSKEPHDD